MPIPEMTLEEQKAYYIALERIEECKRKGKRGLHLDLSHLGLTMLPPEIGQLKTLEQLELYGNRLSTLPPEIGQLTVLTELYLFDNQLTTLPPEIGQLNALLELDLDFNELSTLPPEIGQLSALKEIILSNNQLRMLPPEMLRLQALALLFLHGNPELGIPDSVLGPTFDGAYGGDVNIRKEAKRAADILTFYFALQIGAAAGTLRAVNEIKVMLVGRGEAGKTSLRRFFTGQPHNPNEHETKGIALDDFPMVCGNQTLCVHLWDFAGQEITHALHQLFLTEGCVYILVLDPRSNTEMKDALYWLGLLQRYAGKAPVVLALNRQDARNGGYDVDRRLLKARFPAIADYVSTNCETRTGCDDLRTAVCNAIQNLPNTQPPHQSVPSAWLAVKEECFQESRGKSLGSATIDAMLQARQHLRFEEFRQICAKHGETDTGKQESLARLLHQLGAVLHFVDDPRLRDTSVLNPTG